MAVSGTHRVGDEHTAGRLPALCLSSVAWVLGMSTWFSATAVVPQLDGAWDLSATAKAWWTIGVQLDSQHLSTPKSVIGATWPSGGDSPEGKDL